MFGNWIDFFNPEAESVSEGSLRSARKVDVLRSCCCGDGGGLGETAEVDL